MLTDETRVTLFGLDCHRRVWRGPGREIFLKSVFRHGCLSLEIQSCFGVEFFYARTELISVPRPFF